MALAPLKLPITTSTQTHLDIEDIQDDLVLLKDGGVALILETTAINFGLLSETEQDAAIYAYAGLLNSLTFQTQTIVRSRRMDITSYVQLLKEYEDKQTNESLRFQMGRYRQFIESIIRENNVLDKRFYVVVPFTPLELGAPSAAISMISSLNPFRKKSQGLPYSKNYIIEKAKNSLYPKKDHIIKQLARIGLRAQQLNTQQLIELFYNIYNPAQVSSQKIAASASDYTTPLVTAAVEEDQPKEEQRPKAETKPDPAPSRETPPPQAPTQDPAAPSPDQVEPPAQEKLASPNLPQRQLAGEEKPAPDGSVLTQPEIVSQVKTEITSAKEPEWLQTVQQKVANDQDKLPTQPKLKRAEPPPPIKRESIVIGNRVASPPGQVSFQTQAAKPAPPESGNDSRSPNRASPGRKTEGVVFES